MKFGKLYELLCEMPELNEHPFRSVLDNAATKKFTFDYKEKSGYKFLEIVEGYNVYLKSDNDFDYYLFTDDSEILASISIDKSSSFYISDTIWKCKTAEKRLMLKLFINFLIFKYPFIECHPSHTIYAKNFWISLIKHYITNNHQCSRILRLNGEIKDEVLFTSVIDFEEQIDSIWSNKNITLRIYA